MGGHDQETEKTSHPPLLRPIDQLECGSSQYTTDASKQFFKMSTTSQSFSSVDSHSSLPGNSHPASIESASAQPEDDFGFGDLE